MGALQKGKMGEYLHNYYTLDTLRIATYPCRIDGCYMTWDEKQRFVSEGRYLTPPFEVVLVTAPMRKVSILLVATLMQETCANMRRPTAKGDPRPRRQTLFGNARENTGPVLQEIGIRQRRGKSSFLLRAAGSALEILASVIGPCSKAASYARRLPSRNLSGHSSLVPVLHSVLDIRIVIFQNYKARRNRVDGVSRPRDQCVSRTANQLYCCEAHV